MSLTDPVADLLTRIRNGARARHPHVDVPTSKLKLEIVRILRDEGYLTGYSVETPETAAAAKAPAPAKPRRGQAQRPVLRIKLKYDASDEPVISDLQRVSKPGCRVYVGRREIRPVLGGLGITILSTPKGVMTGREARKIGVGGELLCEVW